MNNNQMLALLLDPLDLCKKYEPFFGTSTKGVSLDEFHSMYGNDIFYSGLGLDSDLIYAAHRTAGGLTSIYRQIGIGVEHLLREIIKENLSLSNEQISWSYTYQLSQNKTGVHTLDARICTNDIRDINQLKNFNEWLQAAQQLTSGTIAHKHLRGAIFEIRQGYKSADSKRQNADLRFASNAHNNNYLPVIMVMSSQTSQIVIQRYRQNGILVLTGEDSLDNTSSTYAFFVDIIGFDLSDFFARNSDTIKKRIGTIIRKLLYQR